MNCKLKPDGYRGICYNKDIVNRKDGRRMRTVFEKFEDIDLMAVIAITEDFKRRDVDGVTVTDKDVIRQMFRK